MMKIQELRLKNKELDFDLKANPYARLADNTVIDLNLELLSLHLLIRTKLSWSLKTLKEESQKKYKLKTGQT